MKIIQKRAGTWRCLALGVVAAAAILLLGEAASADGAGRPTQVVTVTAGRPTEYAFKLSRASVKRGRVIFKVRNIGKQPHGFTINGVATHEIRPRHSATLSVLFKRPGRYVYQCVIDYWTEDDVPNLVDTSNAQRCGGGTLLVQ